MAALCRTVTKRILGQISQSNPSVLPSSSSASILRPSYALISRRGIAYKLFVGGLSFYTSDKGLAEKFSEYGQVVEAKIITDKASDRSKGFGFVTFASKDEADRAVKEMNGKVFNGRVVFVDTAKPSTYSRDGIPIARGPPDPVSDP